MNYKKQLIMLAVFINLCSTIIVKAMHDDAKRDEILPLSIPDFMPEKDEQIAASRPQRDIEVELARKNQELNDMTQRLHRIVDILKREKDLIVIEKQEIEIEKQKQKLCYCKFLCCVCGGYTSCTSCIIS